VVARIDQKAQSKRIEILATDPSGRNAKVVGEISSDDFEGQQMSFFGAVKDARAIQVLKAKDGALGMYPFAMDGQGFGAPADAPSPLLRAEYDPRFGRARVAYYSTGAGERAYHFDPEDQKTQTSLEKALAGASVSILSRSIDGGRIIATARYADKPDEYYLYDKPGKRLELVAVKQQSMSESHANQ
jgi:dipeptidyl aminopeptidase/acylaminoacyl peptidase